MKRMDWQSKGASQMGDAHGPIYIYEATTEAGVRVQRYRKRGTKTRIVYYVPATATTFGTLREALNEAAAVAQATS